MQHTLSDINFTTTVKLVLLVSSSFTNEENEP